MAPLTEPNKHGYLGVMKILVTFTYHKFFLKPRKMALMHAVVKWGKISNDAGLEDGDLFIQG